MRIIAGVAKGRTITAPRRGTRPMTGRVRESIFSILADRMSGAAVLDLYAGSGSLGLESLSRGAADAVFVEKSRSAVEILRENVERVGLGGTVRSADVLAFLRSERRQYDLIFLDPPYSTDDTDVGLVIELLDIVLPTNGIVVMHRQARSVVSRSCPISFILSTNDGTVMQ